MRNLKKFLALVLAMMMALSLMVTANAQNAKKEYDDVADAKFSEAIDVLTGMGVFKGHDGDFRPTEIITRAEAAAVLYRLTTGDVEDKQVELYAPQAYRFTDVTPGAWYAGYVGFAVDAGYVKGYNGEFMPSKSVTGYEMLAMLLRAVGYGKNGEFTGDSWRINVGATAQSLKILKPIESTHYANTLSQGSAREVVAELAFVTATEVPTVTWTMLGGYNQYKTLLSTDPDQLNDTLGAREFGLTSDTGFVVGNQATDEDKTLVGLKLADVDESTGYEYPGAEVKAAVEAGEGVEAADAINAEALKLDIKTGLDLFGHKVKVWYDKDSGDTKKTYAVIDQAKSATVFAEDKGDENGVITWDGDSKLAKAADGAGFKTDAPTQSSDRFGQIAKVAANKVPASKVGMYRLIDNNGDGKVDVVISLNQEVARITQRNSTAKDKYIFIGNGDSQFGDLLNDKLGKLLDSKLAPDSDTTLGHVVTVNEIVGTSDTKIGNDEVDGDKRGEDGKEACHLYEVKELKPTFTGTISTYKLGEKVGGDGDDKNDTIIAKVTLTNNDSYDLSGITGADAQYKTDEGKPHLLGGVTKLTSANIAVGKTYSFYEDELGRFIGVSTTNEYKFLYTTFADYEIGALGTGTSAYYAYGVDWDGNIVSSNNQIKRITLPFTAGEDGKPNEFDEEDGTEKPFSGSTLPDGYNLLPVTMRDQGNSSSGNRIKGGANTRFVLDGEGHLSWYDEDCSEYGYRFTSWYDKTEGVAAASTTWTITAENARNGFVRVYNDKDEDIGTPAADGDNVDYLLTNETKFLVVSGTGTGSLSVKPYDGLVGLLNGYSTVEITFKEDGHNIYFRTADTQYGNVDTSKNNTVTTVILSEDSLFHYSTENLYFAAPGSVKTGVKLLGNDDLEQYELYINGKPAYYWVDTGKGDEPIDTSEDEGDGQTGDFYTLAKIDEVSGQPVYKATKVTGNGTNLVGAAYKYVTVNNVNTAEIDTKVYKVGGATVAEIYGENEPDIETNGIDTVEKLNHAISMGLANASGNLYDVTVAIVYDGIDVSCIYVTNIVDNGAPAEEGDGNG